MTTNLIAVANGTTGNAAAYSSDGVTWNSSNLPTHSHYSCGAIGGNTYVVINSSNSTGVASNVYTSANGITWTANTLPGVAYYSINWNGSVFAATDFQGNVVVSSNGSSWTTHTTPRAYDPAIIASDSSGTFLMVDSGGHAYYSTNNGSTWTSTGLISGLVGLPTTIVYGNGVFVVSEAGGTLASTSDLGATWTTTTMGVAGALQFCRGVFLVTAGFYDWTSTDGINWTSHYPGLSGVTLGVGNNNFLTINSSYATQHSTDGLTWTSFTNNPFTTGTPVLIFGALPAVFKVSGNASSSSSSTITTSIHHTYTKIAKAVSTSSATISSINHFVRTLSTSVTSSASSYASKVSFYNTGVLSTSAATLSSKVNRALNKSAASTSTGSLALIYSLARWTNLFPVLWSTTTSWFITKRNTVFTYTGTGTSWSSSGNQASSYDWNVVGYNGTYKVALSSSGGAYAASTTWLAVTMPVNRTWTSLATGGTIMVATAASSNKCARSTTGTSWTEYTMPTTDNWNSVAWNGTVFCAVNDSGTCATSTDGTTWSSHSMPDTQSYNAITYALGQFTAIGQGGVAAKSTDGSTWTRIYLPLSTSWTNISPAVTSAGTNCIMAIAKNTPYSLISTDGSTFTLEVGQPSFKWLGISGITGKFLSIQADLSNRYVAQAFSITDNTNWNLTALPNPAQNCAIAVEPNGISTSFDGINFAPSGKGLVGDTYYVHCQANSTSTATKV